MKLEAMEMITGAVEIPEDDDILRRLKPTPYTAEH